MEQLLKEPWKRLSYMKTKNTSQNIIKAKASFVHTSPRKLRLVADAVRGQSPTQAVLYLTLLPQRAARVLLKVFEQGLGNAKNNSQISPADLAIKSLQIQEGPRGPDVHAHGARFDRGIRRKRFSHIYLELESKPASTKVTAGK